MTRNISEIPATTEDAFLGGRLIVSQALDGSRAGLDAIFLAAACSALPGETVLDVGTGSGIVALAVAARVENVTVTGVEIDPVLAQLAEQNAERNGLGDRMRVICGDVTAIGPFTKAGVILESFDHVLANPPFLVPGEARLPPEARLRRAHACTQDELQRWVKFFAAFCKPKGTLTIVHRADALSRLLGHLEGRFGGLTLYPLFPREGVTASRILIQGRKGSRAPMRIARGMVLHGTGNTFTPTANAILREGHGLDIRGT
jgi:tRNA1(Val) A37 N6-methylase TrmN6